MHSLFLTSRVQKKKPWSKAVLERPRAHWNAGLEKGLVELLHDHNNNHYRSQNGWSPDAWNRIVKLLNEKFPYVNFTKTQIQDKERELKREYRLLKEARKQSGASWDDKLCMIVADQAVWDNIIISHRNAKKFQNKSFPLFEALGELYDVRTRQVECEVADKAKAGSGEDEYSIKNCISLVKTMQELTGEEKVEVVDLFKDAQNRIRKNCGSGNF